MTMGRIADFCIHTAMQEAEARLPFLKQTEEEIDGRGKCPVSHDDGTSSPVRVDPLKPD